MADKIYIMPSGKIALQNGKPVVLSQEDFEDCCCDSAAPCTDCNGAQPDAVVTVTGTCTDQTDCDDRAATYDWEGFDPGFPSGVACFWEWRHPDWAVDAGELWVMYTVATGAWHIWIGLNGNVLFEDADASGITCVGGELQASAIAVPGVNGCTDCTAHVTLG